MNRKQSKDATCSNYNIGIFTVFIETKKKFNPLTYERFSDPYFKLLLISFKPLISLWGFFRNLWKTTITITIYILCLIKWIIFILQNYNLLAQAQGPGLSSEFIFPSVTSALLYRINNNRVKNDPVGAWRNYPSVQVHTTLFCANTVGGLPASQQEPFVFPSQTSHALESSQSAS